MKIVHIITGLNGGGAQYLLLRLLPFQTAHHQVEVISLSDVGPIGEKIRATGVPVHALGMKSSFNNVGAFFALRSLIAAANPDVVHTWMYHADLMGGLAARSLGIKSVVWALHSPDVDARYIKPKTRAIARLCAMLSGLVPAQIVSCAHDAWAKHEKFGYRARELVVIPNGFDLSHFRPDAEARKRIRTEFSLGDDTPVVGMLARFNEQKGHKDFVSIAKEVLRSRPDVRFLLAGREITPDNATLTGWLRDAGIAGSFVLAGLRTDIADVMNALDVLASPSLGEAFPLIVGEAMACGIPCVATDVGDTAWIIGENGVVTPPGDLHAFAAGLLKILDLPKSERNGLASRARNRVSDNFDLAAIAQKYLEIYAQVVQSSAPHRAGR